MARKTKSTSIMGDTIKSVIPNSSGFGIYMKGKGDTRVVANSPQITATLIKNQLDESPANMKIKF